MLLQSILLDPRNYADPEVNTIGSHRARRQSQENSSYHPFELHLPNNGYY